MNRVAPSLQKVNVAFHSAYDDGTKDSEEEAPVFVLLGDVLTLHRGRRSETFLAVPASFHELKAAVHAPVAAFTLLREQAGERCSVNVVARVKKIRDWSEASIERVDDENAALLLRGTVDFLDRVLSTRVISRKAVDDFARACGKVFEQLTDHAAKVELECLHSSVEIALSRLSPRERKALHVVVAGRHQARDRSLGMQYFRERLGEKSGQDERVIYAEGADTVADALALIGKRRIDRDLARAFFGDAKRMQRDVLGDAAKRILSASKLEPIRGR